MIAQLGALQILYFTYCERLTQLPKFPEHLNTIFADWSNENWYVHDNFLGFVVCYCGELINIRTHLIPLCDDGMSGITQTLSLSNHSYSYPKIYFFLVPFVGLWDTSTANGKTTNDYGLITLCFSGDMKKYGLHLLYKNDTELDGS
ncbi:hypothetical protein MTR67_025696 [Solanum verrucosum]|uniref:C-JID domain-containing protein n=1 Tax=Solanum verrucosum TaxID=315347 RepID=A0AAF0QZ83_SOLVR|nr:hypothetical protein MTR67_025696 [Solanum verrucosum]